jgi:hypothetical protein
MALPPVIAVAALAAATLMAAPAGGAGGGVHMPKDAFPYATTYNRGLGGGLTKASKGPNRGTRGARYFFGGSSK